MAIDKHIAIRPAGSFAEVCMACPHPGVNTISIPRRAQAENERWAATNPSDRRAMENETDSDMFEYEFDPNMLHPRLMSLHRHLRSLFLAMDGNFKLINLQKKNNLNDPSLWNGRGFFRAREALESHMKEFSNIRVEVSNSLRCPPYSQLISYNRKESVVSSMSSNTAIASNTKVK